DSVLRLTFDTRLDSGGESHDAGYVQGAGAYVTLLPPAVQYGYAGHVPAEQQGAHPDRAAELVPRHGQRGGTGGGEVDRYLPDRLDGIGVVGHAPGGGQRGDLGHRLDGTHLVVRPHRGDQGHLVAVPVELRGQRRKRHPAEPVNG